MNSEKIREYLSKCEGLLTDVLYDVYSIVMSYDPEYQAEALMYVCENIYKIESDGSIKAKKRNISEEQYIKSLNRIEKKLNQYITETAEEYSKNERSPIDFYSEIWNYIQSSKLCKSKRDRVIAMVLLSKNDNVPYISVGIGTSMEEEEFKSIIDNFDENIINKIKYILEIDYDQLTQKSSLLLNIISSLNTEKEKIVLLGLILEIYKDGIIDKIKYSLDNL